MVERKKYTPEKVLENWRELLEALPHMNEEELRVAVEAEASGARRKDFIIRLHRRYNKLRSERELEEILT